MAGNDLTCTVTLVGDHVPRWIRRRWSDVALAAGMLAISASVLVTMPSWTPGPGAWLLVIGHTAPVAFRRTSPAPAFAVSIAAGIFYVALGWPVVGLGIASLVMTHSLAAHADRRHSLVGVGVVEAALVAFAVVGTANRQVGTLVGNLLVLGAAWTLGDASRRRRLEALAEQQRLATRAVTDERLRIARELHDVVAHSMSVIAVQAGTGRVVIDDDVDHARRALESIEETSRQALDEMRRLLGVLRANGDDRAKLAPLPTLDDLDRLVADAVEGGTPVDVVVEGDPRLAPPGIQLAAYRVVQEALTNVRRHAPGAAAHLRVMFEAEQLVVQVENRLAGTEASAGHGHGLVGMRERASLYGGTLEAGPRPDGTFRVRARFPYVMARG